MFEWFYFFEGIPIRPGEALKRQMTTKTKTLAEITLPGQSIEIKEETQEETLPKEPNGLEEMPSVTKLLNRKKLEPGSAHFSEQSGNSFGSPTSLEMETAVSQNVTVEVVMPAIEAKESMSATENVAPTIIAPARQRGARVVTVQKDIEPASEIASSMSNMMQKNSGPPVFSKVLVLDQLDFKGLQKYLPRHEKSMNMKKFGILSYFGSYFCEIAFFKLSSAADDSSASLSMDGVLGFGNPHLVAHARSMQISAELLPGIFEVAVTGSIFVGPVESLRSENHAGLSSLGFTRMDFLGVFPVFRKKSLIGLWICGGGGVAQEIPAKELISLKKLLSDLAL